MAWLSLAPACGLDLIVLFIYSFMFNSVWMISYKNYFSITVLPYTTTPITAKRSCSPPGVFLSTKTTTPMKQHGMSPLLKTVPQTASIVGKTEISPPRSSSRFSFVIFFRKKLNVYYVNFFAHKKMKFSRFPLNQIYRHARYMIIARLSKAKSTTHDFAQAIMKKLLNQKINYPIS